MHVPAVCHWFDCSQSALRRAALAVSALAIATALVAPARAATIDDVRTRGHIVCGVSDGAPGFAEVSPDGVWAGLDIDFCGALAAAVLGKKDAVKYRVVTPANRMLVLSAGEVDVLPRANAMTFSRDTEHGVRFVGALFYDGQGFLVRRGHAVASVLELSGASVCVMAGTGAAEGIENFFQARRMRYQPVVAKTWQDAVKAYADGACTLLSSDVTMLAAERSRLVAPGDHAILPEMIALERLGPIVRQGDDQWFSIVRWTVEALLSAEELGLTSQNVDGQRDSDKAEVRRFLGLESDLGRTLGLARDWTYQVVRQAGSYGELFERNVGTKSPLALSRGPNNLWMKDGLMSGAPLR